MKFIRIEFRKMLMRLDGNTMVVGIKDASKLIGIIIIACCAVLVCTMFMNYNLDIMAIKDKIISDQVMVFYDAQVSTAIVVSAVSGGCLLITSIIMLLFYIKHYIDTHKKELGILKALGYSNLKIAKDFWLFGTSVFIGTTLGFIAAFLIMPLFYEVQNKDKILPEITVHFHPILFAYLVIIPTIVFAVVAICYAWYKLKTPVMCLLKDTMQNSFKIKQHKDTNKLFLDDLKKEYIIR